MKIIIYSFAIALVFSYYGIYGRHFLEDNDALGVDIIHSVKKKQMSESDLSAFMLLYSYSQSQALLLRLHLDGIRYELVNAVVSSQVTSVPFGSVDFSRASNEAFFSLGHQIGIASLLEIGQSESNIEILDPRVDYVGSLSYDWVREKIFFVGHTGGVNGIYPYDVRNKLTLVIYHSLSSSDVSICVAANISRIYWVEDNQIVYASLLETSAGTPSLFLADFTPDTIRYISCDSSTSKLSVYIINYAGIIYVNQYSLTSGQLISTLNTVAKLQSSEIAIPDGAIDFAAYDDQMFLLFNQEFVTRSVNGIFGVNYVTPSFQALSLRIVHPSLQPGISIYQLECQDEECCTSPDNGGCDQICSQVSPQAYICDCQIGFVKINLYNCSLDPSTTNIYYSYHTHDIVLETYVRSRSISGDLNTTLSLIPARSDGSQIQPITTFDYSMRHNSLYLFELPLGAKGILSSVSLADRSRIDLLLDVDVKILRYDWINDYIYWTDSTGIQRMRPDANPTTSELFYAREKLLVLDIDPIQQLICTVRNYSEIICLNLMTKTVNMSRTLDYITIAFSLDYLERRMYTLDIVSKTFISCSYDGSDCFAIFNPTNDSIIIFMNIIHDKIFWLSNALSSILSMNKRDGSDLLALRISSPASNFNIDAMAVNYYYSQAGINGGVRCLTDNGGCSHFCTPTASSDSYYCECPDSYRMLEDNRTCEFLVPETEITTPRVYATYAPCPDGYCNLGTCFAVIEFFCVCPIGFAGDRCERAGFDFQIGNGTDNNNIFTIIGSAIGGAIFLIAILIASLATILVILFVRYRHIKTKEATKTKTTKQNTKDFTPSFINESYSNSPQRKFQTPNNI